MTSTLIDTVNEQQQRLDKLEEVLKIKEGQKDKKFKIKIPWKVRGKIKKTTSRIAVLYIGHNGRAEWKLGEYRDGLWYVGKESFLYEEAARYEIGKVPFIVVFGWRLTPVGGTTEEYRSRVLGGEEDKTVAEDLGLKNLGQQTIIRAIEHAELDKDQPKKSGGSWLLWILLAVGAFYLISRFMGGG